MPVEVSRFHDQLHFGRHQFSTALDLDLNSEDDIIESPIITNDVLPITFQLKVYPKGVDQDRRQFLSAILDSQVVDDSLLLVSLRTQISAVMWIESSNSTTAAADVPNSKEEEKDEKCAILVHKKSITLPIGQFSEVARIRETFSQLVKREELLQSCLQNTAAKEEEGSNLASIRIRCKITIEPYFGSAEERAQLFESRQRTYDLQLNFFTSPSSSNVPGGCFNKQQRQRFIRTHQWQLMRSPRWRRLLFDHLGPDQSGALPKVLIVPAPEGLRPEAVLELLRFYYGLKFTGFASQFKLSPVGYRHFTALVDVALFSEDRDFMARIFSELLGSSVWDSLEEGDDGEQLLLLPDLLPTAFAFRRLARRHNVLPVVAKFDALIMRIFERMGRRLVEASDLVPLEAVLLPPPHQQPAADPVHNGLLYTLFDKTAVECFLSNHGSGGNKAEVVNEDNLAEDNEVTAPLHSTRKRPCPSTEHDTN